MENFVSNPLQCLRGLLLPLAFLGYLQSHLLAQPAAKARRTTSPLPSTENKTEKEQPTRWDSSQLCPVGTCASSPTGSVLIIHQHVGRLVNARNSTLHGRYSLEGPFLAVVVIGSIFLVMTIIFILVSLVFLKKQNKVFSLRADSSGEVLSHASRARHIEEAVVMSEGYSISDSFDDMSEESMTVELPPEEEEENVPGQVIIANNNATNRHVNFCSVHSVNSGRQGQSIALPEFTAAFVNSGTLQNFEV
ncbi:hypothetical protein SprV_0902760500 [Sparganum proliferum]